MKKSIKKIIAIGLISSALGGLPITGVYASAYTNNQIWNSNAKTYYMNTNSWEYLNGAWVCRNKNNNQICTNSWICTEGNWYYVNQYGNIVSDTWVNDSYIDKNGVWNSNAKKDDTAEIQQRVMKEIPIVHNTTNNPYTNESVAKVQKFDGTDGFKEIGDNKYVYYENGVMLNNCWKKFDDGIRCFDYDGTMICDKGIYGICLGHNGVAYARLNLNLGSSSGDKSTESNNEEMMSNKVMSYLISNYDSKNYSLPYIKYVCDIFNIGFTTKDKEVYDKSQDGQAIDIGKDNNSIVIYIGKYVSRLDLDN